MYTVIGCVTHSHRQTDRHRYSQWDSDLYNRSLRRTQTYSIRQNEVTHTMSYEHADTNAHIYETGHVHAITQSSTTTSDSASTVNKTRIHNSSNAWLCYLELPSSWPTRRQHARRRWSHCLWHQVILQLTAVSHAASVAHQPSDS